MATRMTRLRRHNLVDEFSDKAAVNAVTQGDALKAEQLAAYGR